MIAKVDEVLAFSLTSNAEFTNFDDNPMESMKHLNEWADYSISGSR